MFDYDDSLPVKKTLQCRCYKCDKEIRDVTQYWDFYSGLFKITIKCHNEEHMVKLSEHQIESSNKSGVYWAFMDRA